MPTSEILAPVGGKEQLIAAVRCGADAVYLGGKGFNARRNAENFEGSTLRSIVSYCHARGVKVHLTVNTLVTDGELSALSDAADEIAEAGADAVIVQDLAVMRLFLSRYPSLPVHASTQCAIHNADGAKFFEDMGVSRAVLARELSIDEIAKIRQSVSIELEAFVHGALCMSVSGACYLSSMIGGRSGNRGLCAQPCRLDFKSRCGGHALSLKDMSHLKHIPALRDAGVCSFKIEGRMKRPEYVAAAVTAAKSALLGESYDESALRAVFSRSGFTDGYAEGCRGAHMFGFRGHEDVLAANKVLRDLSLLYDKETPRVGVSMSLSIGSGSASSEDAGGSASPKDVGSSVSPKDAGGSALTLSALSKTVTVRGPGGIAAEKRATDSELAEKNLSKCGGTQFYLESLELSNPKGLMLPPSAINSLRREGLTLLNDALSETVPHKRRDYTPLSPEYAPPADSPLWARFEKLAQIFSDKPDKIILPIEEIDPSLIGKYGGRLCGELPALMFPEDEERTKRRLRDLKNAGLSSLWTENVYGIELGKSLGLPVFGGAGLNVLNTQALPEYQKAGLSACTVSFELNMSKISQLKGTLPRGFIAYGCLPLMRVRNCPARPAGGCGGCKGVQTLTDRTGAVFPLLCRDRRYQTLLNSVPLHIGSKKQARCDFRLLYFTLETPDECRRIYEEIKNGAESKAPRTGGLYFRELK